MLKKKISQKENGGLQTGPMEGKRDQRETDPSYRQVVGFLSKGTYKRGLCWATRSKMSRSPYRPALKSVYIHIFPGFRHEYQMTSMACCSLRAALLRQLLAQGRKMEDTFLRTGGNEEFLIAQVQLEGQQVTTSSRCPPPIEKY